MSKKQYGLLVLVALLAGIVGGVVSSQILEVRLMVSPGALPREKTIRTERMELVSQEGRVLAAFESLNGSPKLRFFDKEGKPVITLGENPSDRRGPFLVPKNSDISDITDSRGLFLTNTEGDVELVASTMGPQLRLKSEKSIIYALASYLSARLDLNYEEPGSGHANRGHLSASPESADLQLSYQEPPFFKAGESPEEARKRREEDQYAWVWWAKAEKEGVSISLYDEEGHMRSVLGNTELVMERTGSTEKRAASSLVLFDKKGKVIWQAP